MTSEIFTLGHSSLTFERVLELLKEANISAVADVRSSPFSKQSPWFSQNEFKSSLRANGIAYAFLGVELGGRPKEDSLFANGVANYRAMAETPQFKAGLARILEGKDSYRIALVCSERDPLHCHRCLLVGRQLAVRGIASRHIHANGRHETHDEAENRLLFEEQLDSKDLYFDRVKLLDEAYLRRNKQVAYSNNQNRTAEAQWSKR